MVSSDAARAGARGRETDETYAEAWDFSPGAKGISVKRPVDTGTPNAWGLYWMLGNVAEWCQDRYGPHYYRNSAIANPQGPRRGRSRIVRGGGANYVSFTVFAWSRGASDPAERQDSVGFRLVREKAGIR